MSDGRVLLIVGVCSFAAILVGFLAGYGLAALTEPRYVRGGLVDLTGCRL